MARQVGATRTLTWAAPVAVTAAMSVALGLLTLRSENPSTVNRVLSALAIVSGLLACLAAWFVMRRLDDAGRIAQDSSRRLNAAAATGHELVWEIDRNGVMTYLSDVAREMFGVDPAEIVGQSCFILLPPDEQHRARSLLSYYVRERRGWDALTFPALHTDGELRWVETSGVAHLDGDGEVIGFTATTHQLDAQALTAMALTRTRERVEDVLAHRGLTTVFQPIVDVESGVVVGHEALSRFPAEPAQGPDRWFADADATGLGLDLDLLALETALGMAQQLPAACYVSVNVTPATLQSDRLGAAVASAGIYGDRIVVEITEHVSVDDYQTLREPLERLRLLGVRLAVDDAGAGYASFRHILRLRPEFIKLDQEIIRGIHADPARRALAAAVVMFALDVGATVIAEGVETAEELDMVTTLGIDAVQGYLLGRPTADPAEWARPRRLEATRPG